MVGMLRKFPKTSHLLWLSPQAVRDDKVMSHVEAETFLSSGEIVVEEKVDGANLGLSFDEAGRLRAQNRGNHLEGRLTGQWQQLRGWLARHEAAWRQHLPPGAILFGEWCYAQHSMAYTRLPDWFLGFDVLDASNRFWSTRRRDALLSVVGLSSIQCVARGRFTLRELQAMLSEPSAFGDGPVEGLYLRREDDEWLLKRAKLVRPEFIQAIDAHWSCGLLRANRLAA
jgi:hypothetical protein